MTERDKSCQLRLYLSLVEARIVEVAGSNPAG